MKADEVIKFDKQLQKNEWMWNINTKETNFSTYRILDNKKKIMISVPHSVKHERKWKILPQDTLTWWLALYLWKSLKIPIIYATSYKVWDPNYDRNNDSEYKNTLAKYIKKENINTFFKYID